MFSFQLDAHSGVPVYRQMIDQVQGALAAGRLKAGDQLPTIRQVAVDLAINPNTVTRAYREMEIRGFWKPSRELERLSRSSRSRPIAAPAIGRCNSLPPK